MYFLSLASWGGSNDEEDGPVFNETFPLITSAEVLIVTAQLLFFTSCSRSQLISSCPRQICLFYVEFLKGISQNPTS